jgi:hypothetical protein
MSHTSSSKDLFLPTLWDIISEQSTTIKTQMPRLKHLWQTFWAALTMNLPDIRIIQLDKKRFFSEIPYRLECIRTLEYAMTDGFYVIKAIIDALFHQYIDSDLIQDDFGEQDAIPVSFLISENLVGSLLQFIVLDKTPIPIGFLLIAKNKSIMKLKGRTASQLLDDLHKNGFQSTLDEISNVLLEMQSLGYLAGEMDIELNEIRYKFIKDFTVSAPNEKKYQSKIKPLLEWAVELWRSLYNIRAIDTIIPDTYPYPEFLRETVARAATQGYMSAQNVIENIGNYYKMILEQKLTVP